MVPGMDFLIRKIHFCGKTGQSKTKNRKIVLLERKIKLTGQSELQLKFYVQIQIS